jgi:hypothetical protein
MLNCSRTNTADLITSTSTNETGVYYFPSVTGINTWSIYAKKGTGRYLLLNTNTPTIATKFDLQDGVIVGTPSTGAIPSIQDVGDGWYRCSITSSTSTNRFTIFITDNTTTNDFGSSIGLTLSIWGAQLEQGLVATSYIKTTTSAVYEGIADDVPRVDYSGGGCPSLLLEGQRTNINTQSEYFGASSWNKARMSITDNAVTSPEGVQNAANFVEDSTSNSHPLYDSFAVSSGTSYTVSMFAKKGSRDYFRFNAATSSSIAFFNLANGTVHSGTGIIEDFGNGWYRCSMTFTATSTSEDIYIEPSINGSSANYQGDGSVSMSIYGFQLEAGSYVSSYIPTYGVSSTRVADSCSKTGISELIGQTEGTFYVETKSIANDGTFKQIAFDDGTTSNLITIDYTSTDNQLRSFIRDGGTAYSMTATITDSTAFNKIAIKAKNNDFAMWVNGTEVATSATATYPNNLSNIKFNNGSGGGLFYGNVKQMILFPTALTDNQLEELTK